MGMVSDDASVVFAGMGVHAIRIASGPGRFKPHCALAVELDEEFLTLGVDTTRTRANSSEIDTYLITHAHSDHNGSSAMRSPAAFASTETARALEIRHGREYSGRTFNVGDTFKVGGLEIHTHHTGHTIGACAYSFKTECGASVLVTGDIKDYGRLPKCDLLVTEANYGNPNDESCVFDDDLDGLREALEEPVVLGAYVFGKAQRTVALARAMGFDSTIEMDPMGLALTGELLPEAGELAAIGENGSRVVVVPFNMVNRVAGGQNRYLLTGNWIGGTPRISLSDHLDFRGLVGMVDHCRPQAVLVFHPSGGRPKAFARFLRESRGIPSCATAELPSVVQKRLGGTFNPLK